MGYTTPKLVEYELRAEESFADFTVPSLNAVTSWIEEESKQIDAEAGTSFEELTSTEIIDYEGDDDSLPESLYTIHSPIIEVTKLEYNPYRLGSDEYSTGWEEKTEDEHFTVYKKRGRIDILYPQFKPSEGKKRFRVVYKHGYSTTPALVQKIATKAVALRVINSLLNQKIEDGETGGTVGVGGISIVDPTDYGVKGYESLQESLNVLKDKLLSGAVVYRYGNY